MKMPTLEQIRSNRNVLFWSLHAAGWAAYGISQYFGALLYESSSSYARMIAVSASAGFLLSAVGPAAARTDPRGAGDLLHHGSRTAHRHQSFV